MRSDDTGNHCTLLKGCYTYRHPIYVYAMLFLRKGVAVLTKENRWLKPNFRLLFFVEEEKVPVSGTKAHR